MKERTKNNEPAVTMTGGGIKCDNPNCDYWNPDVRMEDYKHWVNKPCPKCGANLLTKEDYKNVKVLMALTRAMNFIGKICPSKGNKNEDMAKMTVSMNGTGKMDINIEKMDA